jgi:Zn-dependent peptidase ImmA (M78 family)
MRLAVAFDVEELLDELDLRLMWEPIQDASGERTLGALKAESDLVILNENYVTELEGNPGLRRFTLGHEIGHWILHAADIRARTLPLDASGRTWCRSGSREPPERQAEMFAGSLLIPEDQLHVRLRAQRQGGWSEVYEIADAFAVTPTAMLVRLEELGLYHRGDTGTPVVGRRGNPAQETLFG